VKQAEEPDAEKDTCPVLRGAGRQPELHLEAPRLLDRLIPKQRLSSPTVSSLRATPQFVSVASESMDDNRSAQGCARSQEPFTRKDRKE